MKTKLMVILGSALAASSMTLPAYAGIQDFRVHNRSSIPIASLKVSDSFEDPYWGRNVLRQSLPGGYHTNIEFSNEVSNCYFDIQAEFSNGARLSYYHVNLCVVSDVYFP